VISELSDKILSQKIEDSKDKDNLYLRIISALYLIIIFYFFHDLPYLLSKFSKKIF